MARRLLQFLFLVLSFFIFFKASATHLRAGEITAERIDCFSLRFRITITVYIDTESGVRFGGQDDTLDFGDSTSIFVPEQNTIPRPDLGPHMGMATYTAIHEYSGNRRYIIRYIERNRNDHILNMDQSVETRFYLETTIYLDPFLSCNQFLPKLLIPPIDRACHGVAFFHNPGAYDQDGDSLSYELTVPRRGIDQPVINYTDPNNPKFYLNYNTASEDHLNKPSFSINPIDGTLTWDAPGMIGEYNVAFKIVEWRKDRLGNWRMMSYVTRDMQIIVEDCDNHRPDLIVPEDICVTAGDVINKSIEGFDPDNDRIRIEVASEIFFLFTSPASYASSPGIVPASPPVKLNFQWRTQCEHVKDQYYLVVFKITDFPAHGPKLVTFRTWRIKVVAPPPQWESAVLLPGNRAANIRWKSYTCKNASAMQVWRKIGGITFTPGVCETGMPSGLGYKLISTVPLLDSVTHQEIDSFVDTNGNKGLAPGARYCYRLVALFPQPKGGQSYVSEDICLPPIRIDAPVITHVTVEKTAIVEGLIRVSWRSPFEIDKIQFPGPYQYALYRGEGLTGSSFVRVTSENITDTTYVDAGIDTENKAFHYKIILFSNTSDKPTEWLAIDSSATASSVRLEADGSTSEIDLSWKADVPWSNSSEIFPYHLVYRRDYETPAENFTLIDSISSLSNSFEYIDRGNYMGIALNKNKTYCYRILTRGTYGNSLIHEPLENFSEVVCVPARSPDKPCTPVLSLTAVDCDAFFSVSGCQIKAFSNRISWEMECADRVRSFRVYASSSPEREFVLLAENVVESFFVDQNLSSFARCYKVTAINEHGVESELSEMVCNDNCPYFELPNIFTPNGDGCNDYFSAYGPFNPILADAPESCLSGDETILKCMRFVQRVTFQVYNRWGKQVFSYRSGSGAGEKSTYINWDGRDNDGRALSSGVYYYIAYVTFDVMDVPSRHQTRKGWIQLMR